MGYEVLVLLRAPICFVQIKEESKALANNLNSKPNYREKNKKVGSDPDGLCWLTPLKGKVRYVIDGDSVRVGLHTYPKCAISLRSAKQLYKREGLERYFATNFEVIDQG